MIIDTLTSPIILFFILGMVAGFARSDLTIPEAIAKGLAIYLMAAIGLKGGVSVANSGYTADLGLSAVAGLALAAVAAFGATKPASATPSTLGFYPGTDIYGPGNFHFDFDTYSKSATSSIATTAGAASLATTSTATSRRRIFGASIRTRR